MRNCQLLESSLARINWIRAVDKKSVEQLISCQKCRANDCRAIAFRAVHPHSTKLPLTKLALTKLALTKLASELSTLNQKSYLNGGSSGHVVHEGQLSEAAGVVALPDQVLALVALNEDVVHAAEKQHITF